MAMPLATEDVIGSCVRKDRIAPVAAPKPMLMGAEPGKALIAPPTISRPPITLLPNPRCWIVVKPR